jgi:hypothetical protein
MTRIAFLLVAVVTAAGAIASLAPASGRADGEAAPIFVTRIPAGYRDWRLISAAHEEGELNDIRAILGNDTAIKSYREEKLPFPEGSIIARIAWNYVPSEENNKLFFAVPNPSWQAPRQLGIFSLWSRTRKGTPRRAAGGSFNLIRMATLAPRQISKNAFPATRLSKIATSPLLVTHLDPASGEASDGTMITQPKYPERLERSMP